MRRWHVALGVGAMALLAFGPGRAHSGAQSALAAQNWQVTVGGGVEAENIELNAFLPRTLTVNTGDMVNWNWEGFHTVTFNAGKPDLTLFTPDSSGQLIAGSAFFPFPPGPNPPGGPYDGSTQVSSGTTPDSDPGQAPPPFSLTFTKAGVFSYQCMLHPGMAGVVNVLPAGSSLPQTADQAKAAGDAEAAGLVAGIRAQAAQVHSSSGNGVTTVAAGVSLAAGGDVLAFLSPDVTIHRGDAVAWTMADPFEIHTVTFLSGGMTPDFVAPTGPPPAAGPPTLAIAANVAGPAGGPTYSGQGYFNSGILSVGQSYVLNFDTPGTYQYLCLVHPFMLGTVTVTP